MRRPDAQIREAIRGPATLAFALALCAPAAMAQPAIERGRALYETRCIACHEKSVHQRESRKAQDFATLRREVERWSTSIGGEWRAEELDAVAEFLNDRYYRFPCPPAVCREPARAGGASGRGG
jgi:mono/diheme cytochrome c family protein